MVVCDGGEIFFLVFLGFQEMGFGQLEDVWKNFDGIFVEIVIFVFGGQKFGQGGDGDRFYYVDLCGEVGGVGIGGFWIIKMLVLRIGEIKKR